MTTTPLAINPFALLIGNYSAIKNELDGLIKPPPYPWGVTWHVSYLYDGFDLSQVRRVAYALAKGWLRPPTTGGFYPRCQPFATPADTKCLFIGGLSGRVTGDELRAVCSIFGTVESIIFKVNHSIGFVIFESKFAYEWALDSLNGFYMKGIVFRVNTGRMSGAQAAVQPSAAQIAQPTALSFLVPGGATPSTLSSPALMTPEGSSIDLPALVEEEPRRALPPAGWVFKPTFGPPPSVQEQQLNLKSRL